MTNNVKHFFHVISFFCGVYSNYTLKYSTLNNCCLWTYKECLLLLLAAKPLQSCLTLCDPIDGSPPGSSVPGILQARILEWVAISFSNAWKWKVKDWETSLSLFTFLHWRRKWQSTPVFLPREFQGRRSLVGCHLWGRTKLDTTEVT